MAVRVVVGLATVATIVVEWPVLLDRADISLTDQDRQLWDFFRLAVIVVGTVGVASYLLLAIGVFRGSNWARIASMAYSGLLVALAASSVVNGEPTTLANGLFGLPLDILVLLALSAHNSRVWARRSEEPAPDASGNSPSLRRLS